MLSLSFSAFDPEADIGYLTILPAARITVHGGAIFRLIDSKLYR